MADLNTWAASVAGRYIDVDGWAGAQCWDLSQHWLTTCNGGTLWTQPSRYPGLAAGSWEVAMNGGKDLLKHVTAHPGTSKGQPGDIIIWAYGSDHYPISHTAVLIEDRGPILRTLSQNSSAAQPDLPGYSAESSGPSIYQDLPRAGLLGFLRPKTTITGQGSTITPIEPSTEEGFLMALSDADQIEIRDNLRKLVGMTANVQEKVADISTASGPKSIRQFVADGTRAAQTAAAQTAAIRRGGKDVSLRQEVADIKTSVTKSEPVIVAIAEAVVTAPDVDGA